MVLVYAISVIITENTIPYREMCYLVKKPGIQFSVLYRPNFLRQLSNTVSNINSFCLCSFIKSQSGHNRIFYVIQFQFLYVLY
jgi:hypothetical protein